MKNKIFYLFFLASNICLSQTTIRGVVTDSTNQAIPFANVVLKRGSISILSYTLSNDKGVYTLSTTERGSLLLVFSSLGYEPKTILIEIDSTNTKKIINAKLKEKLYELNEVIIMEEKPIFIKKDTIVFDAQAFATGNEQVVEDLLKKIPGISVDSNGTIKVGNQEIEKVMVEGDDFFGSGYKILSKNMPSQPIEKIELLINYSNNSLLKGVEESNKVALNLILNEEAKRAWFGNVKLAYGGFVDESRYDATGNLMNFGKKNSFYFLSNFNNIGFDGTGDINQLIRPVRYNQPASIGDGEQVFNLIDLSAEQLNFEKERTNFNDAKLVSLNAIFNPTNKLKIKTLGFLNIDQNDFFKMKMDSVNVEGGGFTNEENQGLQKKKMVGFGKVDVIYNISDKKKIKSITKYNYGRNNGYSKLIFNGNSTNEVLESVNNLFDQKLTYSTKFKANKVLMVTGRYINEKSPQQYSIDQFFYQDLFPNFPNANNVQQFSANDMQFLGFEGHLMNRQKGGNLLELQVGNQYRKDNLNTTFKLFENDSVLSLPQEFQNKAFYATNDLYFKTTYRIKINNISFIGKVDFHQLYNQFNTNGISEYEKPFYINPTLGFDWEINDKNKIRTSYAYTIKNAKIKDVYSNYALTTFRSFSKGMDQFNQTGASTITINYELGNWNDEFFANTFIVYSKNFNYYSTNTLIQQNFVLSEKILIQDRDFLSISTKLDYYVKGVSSNLRLKLGYTNSNYKNSVNSLELREVKSTNINYGLEIRSGFNGVINFNIGTKWIFNEIETTRINSFTDNLSFLNLSLIFNQQFNIDITTERYYFGYLSQENSTYYFIDTEVRYKLKANSKITLGLSGKNLFNTETFRTLAISDVGVSLTEYRLLPRYVLLKIEYRF